MGGSAGERALSMVNHPSACPPQKAHSRYHKIDTLKCYLTANISQMRKPRPIQEEPRSGRALQPVWVGRAPDELATASICGIDRKSTRLNSSHLVISYAVFCLKKKTSISVRRRPAPKKRKRQPV